MTSHCNQLLNHFWKAIDTGKFIPLSKNKIQKIVSDIYLAGEVIKELDKDDEQVIRESLESCLAVHLNCDKYMSLAEKEIFYFAPGEILKYKEVIDCNRYFGLKDEHQFILDAPSLQVLRKIKSPMKPEEKKKIFSDVDIWYNGKYIADRFSVSMESQGNRYLIKPKEELFSDDYGFTEESFLKLAKRVRKNTGKKQLNILDVGGCGGKAMYDAKNLLKDVVTHNITVDVEPAMYPVDNLYLCPAERMPIQLKENMDIVLSNMAFKDFTAPDLALENCLQALSVGGEAWLSIDCREAPYFHVNEYAGRLSDQFARLKKLKEEGSIKLTVYGNALNHKIKSRTDEYFPSVDVRIRKLNSLQQT